MGILNEIRDPLVVIRVVDRHVPVMTVVGMNELGRRFGYAGLTVTRLVRKKSVHHIVEEKALDDHDVPVAETIDLVERRHKTGGLELWPVNSRRGSRPNDYPAFLDGFPHMLGTSGMMRVEVGPCVLHCLIGIIVLIQALCHGSVCANSVADLGFDCHVRSSFVQCD
jgi:hypothetical protein